MPRTSYDQYIPLKKVDAQMEKYLQKLQQPMVLITVVLLINGSITTLLLGEISRTSILLLAVALIVLMLSYTGNLYRFVKK